MKAPPAILRVAAVLAVVLTLVSPGAYGVRASNHDAEVARLDLEQDSESYAYVPVAMALPVEAVVTARGEQIGYPTYYYVYGYVRNLAARPVYSVTVEVEVTIFPYEPPYTLSSMEKFQVTPALTATLPGQANPFQYGLLLGKASASIGGVRAVAASFVEPSGDVYYPLTVAGWEHKGALISGTVRNDSGRTLHKARVVAAKLDRCTWREAVLDDVVLQPGQETAFHLDYYSSACVDDSLVVVGQGAAPP
jgi:hypothetical protein